MKSPIADFLEKYSQEDKMRMHMPGHKGKGKDTYFKYDITEVRGADSLFEADGIIKESEINASEIFGANTFYSTEGSSLSIRAMLYLCKVFANKNLQKCRILATRNVHKSFISACVLLDIEVDFIECADSYLSCKIDMAAVKAQLNEKDYTALFVTSPDYLGNIQPIKQLSSIAKKCGVLLLVDNAHGAYLKFLCNSMHPIDLGADMCADSAHKTLCALTGGAYLHISKNMPDFILSEAKNALSLFASTSPSYLILASLDRLNLSLSNDYSARLKKTVALIDAIKSDLIKGGYTLAGNEGMKITILAKPYGYFGYELAKMLYEMGVVSEFYDNDFVTLMPSSENGDDELKRLSALLLSIPKKKEIDLKPPKPLKLKRAMSMKEASFMPKEKIAIENARGRVLAQLSVGCPPAVPIALIGEVIDENAIEAFKYYGVNEISVTI